MRARRQGRPPGRRQGRLLGAALALLAVAVVAIGAWLTHGPDDEHTSSILITGTGEDPPAGTGATLVAVTDGDTLRVTIGGVEERVRLLGYDAPEIHSGVECGGVEAADEVEGLLAAGDLLVLVPDPTQGDRDRYGRLLRYAELPDGTDVGREVVSAGWGEVRTYDGPYERLADYRSAEDAARDAPRGVWATC